MGSEIVIRPVRNTDAESLGRVHVQCWHETYDHLISEAALQKLSPKRLADLWSQWASLGDEYRQAAALIDGEIIGFASSGPARDEDAPTGRQLYTLYLLKEFQGTGTGQQLFDAVTDAGESLYLWVAEDNPRARAFYKRNGLLPNGVVHEEPILGESIEEVMLVRE